MSVDPAEDAVLEQPIRTRIFGLLTDLQHAASTGDLAEILGRHPNGIRLHLVRMRDAGLVTSEVESRGRGRPRVLWSVDPDANPGGEPLTAYADLSVWLTKAIGDGLFSPEEIESRGREIGVGLAGGGGDPSSPPDRLRHAFAAMGFSPSLSSGSDDRATYCLGNCPYRSAAKENKAIVCGLHRGITQGFLSEIDPAAELTNFVAKDPDDAGCLVEIEFGSTA